MSDQIFVSIKDTSDKERIINLSKVDTILRTNRGCSVYRSVKDRSDFEISKTACDQLEAYLKKYACFQKIE